MRGSHVATAAQKPVARAALLGQVDEDIALMSVSREAIERLDAVGVARRLALAIHDARYDAAFARWTTLLRKRALDPRLVAITSELGGLELYQ